MSKIDEAISILASLGLPAAQQNERSALTLLALAKLGPGDPWAKVQRPLLRIWDIMGFMRDVHGKDYAANSRETIRRQTIHQFEQARIVDRNPDDPDRPTNSGKTVYVLTEEATEVPRTSERPGTVILPCPNCRRLLWVPTNLGELVLTCPICWTRWNWLPS